MPGEESEGEILLMEERRSDIRDPPPGGAGAARTCFLSPSPGPKGSEVGGEKEEVHAREERREERRGDVQNKTTRTAGRQQDRSDKSSQRGCMRMEIM